jgi:predicted nucleic acid-binding Zn ribbon protein
MPVYEYECDTCGKTFETRQSFSDAPLGIHAQHESGQGTFDCFGKVKRIISRTSFVLKGGSWYRDGYASKPAK